jgi:hypothetical protein
MNKIVDFLWFFGVMLSVPLVGIVGRFLTEIFEGEDSGKICDKKPKPPGDICGKRAGAKNCNHGEANDGDD